LVKDTSIKYAADVVTRVPSDRVVSDAGAYRMDAPENSPRMTRWYRFMFRAAADMNGFASK